MGIFDGPHATPRKTPSGPIFLGIANLASGRLDLTNTEHLSEADYGRWTRRVVPSEGDIVFSYETRLGEAARIRNGLRCCLGRRMGLLRPDPAKVDSRFLLYAFLAPEFQDVIRSRTVHGSTVDRILLTELGSYPIRVLAPDDQRDVGALLGALDDKIELNRRMNETLRKAIRLLFGQLIRGETYEASVADLARYVNGRNFTRDASGDGRMVIRIAELSSGPGTSTVFSHAEAPDEHVARFGDILFAWSGSLGVYRWYADDALINQHIFKVVPNGYPVWFVHQHLLRALPFFRDTAADKATTMGHIKRSHLGEAKVEIPTEAALAGASEVIEPLDDRVAANERESRTLAALRDALLPKLISGELRIRDPECAVEEAT